MSFRSTPPDPPRGPRNRRDVGDTSRPRAQNVAGWIGQIQASTTAGTSQDPIAVASSLMSAYQLGGPWGVAIGAVVTAFSARRNSREERKERRLAAKKTIAIDNTSSVALPLVYGYFKRKCIPVYASPLDSIIRLADHPDVYKSWNWRSVTGGPIGAGEVLPNGRSFGRLPAHATLFHNGLLGKAGQGAILLACHDIAANQVDFLFDLALDNIWMREELETRTMVTDDRELDETDKIAALSDFSYHVLGDPGVHTRIWDDFRWSTEYAPIALGVNTRFTRKSHVISVYWQNDQQTVIENAVPAVDVQGAGAPVSSIVERPGSPGDYDLSTTKAWSNSPMLVEIDRLRDRQNMDEDDFELESWNAAHQLCDRDWSGGVSQIVDLDETYPDIILQDGVIVHAPPDPNKTYRTVLSSRYNLDDDEFNIGFQWRSNTGTVVPTTRHYTKKQWMFNGEIPTKMRSQAQQNLVMESVPGGFVYRHNDGRVAVTIPDYTQSPADQSEGTIEESVLLTPPNIKWPTGDDRITALSTKFNDLSRNFDEEDYLFPEPNTDLARLFLAGNNNEKNIQSLTLEGACDPDQAHSIAISQILQSHRFVGQASVRSSFIIDIKEGSILRLLIERWELDAWVRLMVKKVVENITIIEFQQFDNFDYVFRPLDIRQEPYTPSVNTAPQKPVTTLSELISTTDQGVMTPDYRDL